MFYVGDDEKAPHKAVSSTTAADSKAPHAEDAASSPGDLVHNITDMILFCLR